MTNALTERLDRLEDDLPAVPSTTIAFGRATARRTTSVATAVIGEVTERAGTIVDSTSTAVQTVAGQARSAAERAARQTCSGIRQVRGQTGAQARQVGDTVHREVEAAATDAENSMAPDPNGRRELQSLTKSDLYDRAQDLDIDGRSSMTKEQLVDAIASA